eukprot:6024616-Amphidinium_carterae.2
MRVLHIWDLDSRLGTRTITLWLVLSSKGALSYADQSSATKSLELVWQRRSWLFYVGLAMFSVWYSFTTHASTSKYIRLSRIVGVLWASTMVGMSAVCEGADICPVSTVLQGFARGGALHAIAGTGAEVALDGAHRPFDSSGVDDETGIYVHTLRNLHDLAVMVAEHSDGRSTSSPSWQPEVLDSSLSNTAPDEVAFRDGQLNEIRMSLHGIARSVPAPDECSDNPTLHSWQNPGYIPELEEEFQRTTCLDSPLESERDVVGLDLRSPDDEHDIGARSNRLHACTGWRFFRELLPDVFVASLSSAVAVPVDEEIGEDVSDKVVHVLANPSVLHRLVELHNDEGAEGIDPEQLKFPTPRVLADEVDAIEWLQLDPNLQQLRLAALDYHPRLGWWQQVARSPLGENNIVHNYSPCVLSNTESYHMWDNPGTVRRLEREYCEYIAVNRPHRQLAAQAASCGT